MFSDLSIHASSARFPAPTVVTASVAAHVLIVVAALFYSVAAPGLLPQPRAAFAFVDAERRVQLLDLELPPPSRRVTTSRADPKTITSRTADVSSASPPPVVAPMGIPRET